MPHCQTAEKSENSAGKYQKNPCQTLAIDIKYPVRDYAIPACKPGTAAQAMMLEIAVDGRCGRPTGNFDGVARFREIGRQTDYPDAAYALTGMCPAPESCLKIQNLGFMLEDDDTPGTVDV